MTKELKIIEIAGPVSYRVKCKRCDAEFISEIIRNETFECLDCGNWGYEMFSKHRLKKKCGIK